MPSKNTGKHKTFPEKKEKKITMKVLTTSYKIKFVKSARFIATSLSNLHYQGRNSQN